MDIIINHQRHTLTPIRQFRMDYHLPDNFGVAHFEPKDFTGMASIDGAGDALDGLRQAIVDIVLPRTTPIPTFETIEKIVHQFETTLRAVNKHIGLRDVEIGYATSGFGDVLNTWLYEQMRAYQTKSSPTPFDQIYADWVANSGRRSEKMYVYPHQNVEWGIRLLNNAYGRMGLQVDMPDKTAYVHDTTYLCPAEGFVHQLLRDVVKKLAT